MVMGLLAIVAGFRSESAETQAEDRDCLRRLAAGDSDAAGHLYDRHARAMYSLVLRIVADEGDAEDVVQEVFAQAWRQAVRYDPSRGAVGAWLLMMARTRAIDRLRAGSRRRARETEVEAAGSAPGPGPLEGAVAGETRRHVLRAMEELTDVQRRALELAYFEGMTHTEVAAALGEPLGTIKTRIRQGMLHLKERLQAAYEQGAIP